ncbi:MAG: hypothetical protein KIH69_003125 [Anaerolineae bacterium]|nr:hypothetical protein [Anaerolineae bacterium]
MNNDVSLTDKIKSMSRDELIKLQAFIGGLIDNAAPVADAAAPQGKVKAKRQHSAAFVEIKTIKGRRYAYRRWYEGGKFRSEYIGPANE